jgi:adenosylmethionine-8-amino-7-oxononanoate aminotransferase
MFACELAGVVPDVITLSKALSGGTFPLAATVARTSIFEAFWDDDPKKALMHGPTFMANPSACTAALASLELFEREPVLARVQRLEAELKARLGPLRDVRGVAGVRVWGGIGVVELEDPVALEALRARFVDEGVWIRPLGRCVYLMPAFVISDDELDRLARAIRAVLTERAAAGV